MRLAVIACCVAVLASAGCLTTHPFAGQARGEKALLAAARKAVPPGTPADEALATMRANGFECDLSIGKPIQAVSMSRWSTEGPEKWPTGDSIYCHRSIPDTLILPASNDYCYRVLLVLRDGKVAEYEAYYSE